MSPFNRRPVLLILVLFWGGWGAPLFAQTSTFTQTATRTPSNSPTNTFTKTPTRTPTDTATITITRTPTNSPTQTPTRTPSPTITDTPTPTDSFTPNATLTPPCGAFLGTFGDTSSAGGSGSSTNTMRACMFSLNQAATVYSLWVYCPVAGPKIMTGIYSGSIANIGTLQVSSSPQTAFVGWNGFPITPTLLAPGTYWLAYSYNGGSNTVITTASGAVSALAYTNTAFTFVSMPTNMPGPINYGTLAVDPIYAVYCNAPTATPTISFTPTFTRTPTDSPTQTPTGTINPNTPTSTPTATATKTTTNSPTTTPTATPNLSLTPDCGASALLFGSQNTSGSPVTAGFASEMRAYRYTMPSSGTVETISLFATAADAGYLAKVALYTDSGTTMTNLLGTSASQPLTGGWNVFWIPPATVPAGDYWLAYILDSFPVTNYSLVYQAGSQPRDFAWLGPAPSWVFPAVMGTGGWNPAYVDYQQEPIFASYCSGVVNTNTPTDTATTTPTRTPTSTPTLSTSPTNSPTTTPSHTPTETPTVTNTPTITDTPTITSTPTKSPTATPTGTATNSPTVSPTPTPSNSPTVSPTGTNSPSSTPSSTATPSPTTTPSSTPTKTPTASPTPTPSFSPTPSPTATFTLTFTLTATKTPTSSPSNSPTQTPSSTETFTVTNTFTGTLVPTNSPTPTPSSSPTKSPTLTMTLTATSTATNTPSLSSTNSPTFTLTFTASLTFTPSPTPTGTFSTTATDTPTGTLSPTVTNTPGVSVTTTPVLYPNPVKDDGPVKVNVDFDQPHDYVAVKVFTTAFRKVYEENLQFVPAGAFSYDLDINNFKGSRAANGLYYVVLTTPSNRWISRLLIFR